MDIDYYTLRLVLNTVCIAIILSLLLLPSWACWRGMGPIGTAMYKTPHMMVTEMMTCPAGVLGTKRNQSKMVIGDQQWAIHK